MKNQMNRKPCAQGFTLLEMAIVLLIIAAIVAGVLVGRTIIVNSQLQSVITDEANYMSAFANFKTAYNALPGDYNGATAQWGTDSSGCPSGGGATGTCDGNADGKVGDYCSNGTLITTAKYESYRVWQHLAAAGLFASQLSGVDKSGAAPGVNVPAGSIKGSGFTLTWVDDPSLCSNWYGVIPSSGQYGNVLVFAGASVQFMVLTPAQMDSLDRKMDDGVPNTGQVRTLGFTYQPNCTLNPSGTTYTYNLTYTSRACEALFLTNY